MAVGFTNIKFDDLEHTDDAVMKKIIKQYNSNNKAVAKRLDKLEDFAKDLKPLLGGNIRTARSLVLTPKIAGYLRYTDEKRGLPDFPEVEYLGKNGVGEPILKNKKTGQFIDASDFQSYILAQNSFYTDKEKSTQLSGVNGVYYQTAEFLNLFLDNSQQINMKAYRFQGSTRDRALKDIQTAIKVLTAPDGGYDLAKSALNTKEFWESWNRFKDDFSSNVYRTDGSDKMESVKIFAREFYKKRKDSNNRLSGFKSTEELLKEKQVKNFTQLLAQR